MEVVHPKSSIRKVYHSDKIDDKIHPSQNIFYNNGEGGDRELTPSNSYKPVVEIPHRFQVSETKLDLQKILHGSDT